MKPQFGQPHPQAFAIHVDQRIFAMGADAFGDVVLVPNKAMQSTGQGDGVFVMRGLDQATSSEMDISREGGRVIKCWRPRSRWEKSGRNGTALPQPNVGTRAENFGSST